MQVTLKDARNNFIMSKVKHTATSNIYRQKKVQHLYGFVEIIVIAKLDPHYPYQVVTENKRNVIIKKDGKLCSLGSVLNCKVLYC